MILFILSAGCRSHLQKSRDYMNLGHTEQARLSMLKHIKKTPTEQLAYKTRKGLDFFNLLQKTGNPEIANKLYEMKFQSKLFITYGKSSVRLIEVLKGWKHEELLVNIAERIEKEHGMINAEANRYNLYLYSFASLKLSSKNLPATNSFSYLDHYQMSNHGSLFLDLWNASVEVKAVTLQNYILKRMESYCDKEGTRIMNREKSVISLLYKCSAYVKTGNEKSKSFEKLYLDLNAETPALLKEKKEIEIYLKDKLAPILTKESGKLTKLKDEKFKLVQKNGYNKVIKVNCYSCKGTQKLGCYSCRRTGTCSSCTGGRVDCRSCTGGWYDCSHCCGGRVRVCTRIKKCCKCDICCNRKKGRCRGYIYVTYTYYRVCSWCCGIGRRSCSSCVSGWRTCRSCRGSARCTGCSGRGFNDCRKCDHGKVTKTVRTEAGIDIDRRIDTQASIFNRHLSDKHGNEQRRIVIIKNLKLIAEISRNLSYKP